MKRILTVFSLTFFLASALFAQQSVTLKVLPRHWGLKVTGNGRVKAEIITMDPSAVDTSTILMNGIAAVRTQVTPIKVMAFFPKAGVLATLPAVQKGQTETIMVTFSMGGSRMTLTDTIMIAGQPQGTTDNHGNGQGNHGNGQGNGHGNGQGNKPTHPPAPNNHSKPH